MFNTFHVFFACFKLLHTFSHSIHCFVLFPRVPRPPRGLFSEKSRKVPRKRRWEKVGEGGIKFEQVRIVLNKQVRKSSNTSYKFGNKQLEQVWKRYNMLDTRSTISTKLVSWKQSEHVWQVVNTSSNNTYNVCVVCKFENYRNRLNENTSYSWKPITTRLETVREML